jgi:hypothetical protein
MKILLIRAMKSKLLFSAFFGLSFLGFSQVELSETCVANISVIADEDNSFEDWFEIRNLSGAPVDITGYGLSDNPGQPYKWVCPNYTLAAGEHKYIFASGKDRIPTIDHYESIILANQTWSYLIPTSEPAAAWRLPGTTLTGWSTGVGGIGFGDGDDGTTIPTSTSVYMRRSFTLTNVADIQRLILHMDYDDGFVAYINGVEIARANLGATGTLTPFNTLASNHEALGYQGMPIDDFEIPFSVFSTLLVPGENVLAIQVHNATTTSTDLTSNAYLSAGFLSSTVTFSPTLPWMNLNASTAWHTNFTINSGDNLVLTNAAGVTLANVALTQTPLNHSNNWTGSAWCISPSPTPGAVNSASCFDVVLNKPIISKPAGIYATGFKVAITTDQPNVEIRYTLNGGVPTATSPLYTDSIQIPATKVLSARCFDPSNTTLPSLVEKNSFVINEAFVGLPVISISTDSLNLYDSQTGIYVLGPPDYNTNYPYFGANFWEDWERYSYIEYIATDSTQKFEGAIGLKIHGGWSRAQPQKSFRVKCRDDYGMNKIVYPLIPDKSFIGQYKDFNLRNGGNDYGGSRMRDAFMQRLTRTTHTDYMGYTPVIVFLNGEYFGEYELRETLNNDWVENNHDLDADSASVLTENYMAFEANDGTMENFWPMYNAITSADPLSPTFYDLADSLIDLENFADYIIAETYYGNGDWSNGQPNNIKYWHVPGKKWRMLLMDLDFGYGLYGATANDNFLIQATNNPSIHMDAICSKLLANPKFRVYFIDRYADLINTIWQQNKVQSMGNAMLNEVAPWIPRHHTRWSGNMTTFTNTMNNMLTWNSNRIAGARNVVQSFFSLTGQVTYTLDVQPAGAGRIHISTIEPSELEYPWNGVYFRGVPVKITAIANPGFTFQHWSPNSLFSSNNYNAVLDITPTVNSAFTAWFTGSAITDPLEISEIMPKSENTIDGGDWFELHNRTNVDLNIGGMTVKDSNYFHTYTFPLNTIIPADGHLVVVSDTTAFQQQYPEVTNFIGPLGFNLSGNETIFIYNHNDNVVKQATYSTSLPWPLGVDGHGRSLEFDGAPASQNNPNDWFAGCVAGSPGVAYFPCDSAIIISEINYKSAPTSDAGDWFEIHSTLSSDLNLSGWTITDDSGLTPYTFPAGTTLPAGGYLVAARDMITFNNIHPDVMNVNGPTEIALGANDGVLLYDETGKLRFSVNYNYTSPWPQEPNGLGKTLELLSSTGLMCEPANWFAGCPDGSPGVVYEPICNLGVNELDETAFIVYPNPGTTQFFVNSEVMEGTIRMFNLLGAEVLAVDRQAGTQAINITGMSAGMYLIDLNGTRQQVVIMK